MNKKKIFDNEEYSLYAITLENKQNNPNAQKIVEAVLSKGKKAKAIGGRVYVR